MSDTGVARLRGLRVALVLRGLELGGAERQALLFARTLRRAGVHVGLWSLDAPAEGPVSRAAAADRIDTTASPVRWSASRPAKLRALATLARRLRAARVDVLVPYTAVPNVACGLVAPVVGARLVVWNQRDLGIDEPAGVARRWVVSRTARFVANSAVARRYLVESLGAPTERVSVVPNGVALAAPARGRAEWRRALNLGDAFVACMVANLHRHKDHATVLRAWPRVERACTAAGRDAVLVLAGREDGTSATLRALAGELGIVDRVRFAGPVDDVSGLLAAVDVGVLSSHAEACPNAVLEYMAAGLAVTGTAIAAMKECLGPEAVLAPADDDEALAACVGRLARDPALRAAEGARNRARAETRYAPGRMCAAMADVLVSGLVRESA
jgi:glycosyltransferase involved in cell wall biosynthesis